jgi:hypothetical protein
MKKQVEDNFPKVTFVKSSGNFSFLKGKNLFAEKHARAKETLSRVPLPEGFVVSK